MLLIFKNTKSDIRTVTQQCEGGSHKHVHIPETLAIGDGFGRRGFVVRRTPTNLSNFLPYRQCFLVGHGIRPVGTGSSRPGVQWWRINDLRLESGRKGSRRLILEGEVA
jgi:hypothetical protein